MPDENLPNETVENKNQNTNQLPDKQDNQVPLNPESQVPVSSEPVTPADTTNNPAPTNPPAAPSTIADPIASAPVPVPPSGANTSGQGSAAAVPEEVKGWSWGGFLLTWIWGIGNNVMIALLALVGPISFIMAIYLGIKGRELAWQSKRWDSVEHFNRSQRNWGIAGLFIAAIPVLIILLIILIVAINPAGNMQD